LSRFCIYLQAYDYLWVHGGDKFSEAEQLIVVLALPGS
jgi:hypothetical protein